MKYKVGEICEARSFWQRHAGWQECEIIEVGDFLLTSGDRAPYVIKGCYGVFAVQEDQLRKKHPPQQDNEAGNWSQCSWVPDEIFESWHDKLEI